MVWCALLDAIPLYPLYALLFADGGLSAARIAGLFALWSLVGLVAEVPAGAWADRYSRRAALILACVLQAAGFAAWMALPNTAGFAAGFVLWGVGGALASGAFEALLYDGLAIRGAQGLFPRALAMAEAATFAVQLPVALAAAGLFAVGGFGLVGAVSVVVSLAAAALAATLHDERPANGDDADADDEPCYLATLAAGLREAVVRGPVRILVVAIALLAAAESLEEIFPLLARAWGVSDALNPLVLVVVPVAGALGSLRGGRAAGLATPVAALLAALAGAALAAALLVGHPAGVLGLAVFYGVCRLLAVVASARLQARIAGPARATVTSVASLGAESAAIALYGALALGGVAI